MSVCLVLALRHAAGEGLALATGEARCASRPQSGQIARSEEEGFGPVVLPDGCDRTNTGGGHRENALTFGTRCFTSTCADTAAMQVAELGHVTRFTSSLQLMANPRPGFCRKRQHAASGWYHHGWEWCSTTDADRGCLCRNSDRGD